MVDNMPLNSLAPLFFLQRDELGALVSLEMGKILTEGVGEVQEFVDIVSKCMLFDRYIQR
jgi:acyl-CoA reductase-like NAD-dependent aldehyde dehydrogenase